MTLGSTSEGVGKTKETGKGEKSTEAAVMRGWPVWASGPQSQRALSEELGRRSFQTDRPSGGNAGM